MDLEEFENFDPQALLRDRGERQTRSERIADGLQLSQLLMRKIGSSFARGFALAGDLNNPTDFAIDGDGCAHDLLNRVGAGIFGDRNGFENR